KSKCPLWAKVLVVILGGHFDFLPTCKPAARAVLAEEGEDFICATSVTKREKLHQQTVQQIVEFLHQQHILR
ncbi:MAG: hypothetical protein ACEQSN_07700, partial [Yersinia sp. (in: enterobacteria)]